MQWRRRLRRRGSLDDPPPPVPAHASPHASPSKYQAASSSVHSTRMITTYGNISDTTVPTPASFWYSWAKATINTKYAFNGVMALMGESATRYAASTASGATPSFMSSGTKMGAKMAHFGIAPVMTRSRMTTTNTNPRSNHSALRFALLSTSAIFTAAMVAMLV